MLRKLKVGRLLGLRTLLRAPNPYPSSPAWHAVSSVLEAGFNQPGSDLGVAEEGVHKA
jgi:hypothetical protein